MNDSNSERDALVVSAEELEAAENQDDEGRLAALDAAHARLSDELDKPAAEPPSG